jgi:ankyrin repeat protein
VVLNQRAGATLLLGINDKAEQARLLAHLIAHGLDINAPDARSSLTALQVAAASGRSDGVVLLLDHGARCAPPAGQGPLTRS